MESLVEAARFLHIPAKGKALKSPIQFLDRVQQGLPVGSVDRIAGAIAPADVAFRYRIVPKATLARRKSERRLNKAQSEVVARLAEVWVAALRVWKSDEGARGFLNRGHALLENKSPIDVALGSEMGAQLVKEVLGRLEHGTAV